MAENVPENSDHLRAAGSRPSSASKEDREAKIKYFKERQNEERQKKLEEIKVQALAAQRFKEQKEMERRQRLEDMRIKEDAKRQQVEERKRAINEAERNRLESIIRRNSEREARIEARKRNDRSSVFAFGSSTPRLLEPVDSNGSFWGQRRATSTQNITTISVAPLTRRQSEREFDTGSKKRATSAGGLERCEDMRLSTSMYEILHWGQGTPSYNFFSPTQCTSPGSATDFGNSTPQTPAGCVSGYVGRRRTDLVPTIPLRESPSTPRKPFTRSPGRAYSMSRLDQLSRPRKRVEMPSLAENTHPPLRPLSRPKSSSVSRSMSHLVSKTVPMPTAPALAARKSDSSSMQHLASLAAPPLPPPRTTRATQLRQQKLAQAPPPEAPSRPSSSLSHQSTSSVASSVTMRTRPVATPRKPRPISIAITGITSDPKNGLPEAKRDHKPPLPKSRKSSLVKDEKRKSTLVSPTEETQKPVVAKREKAEMKKENSEVRKEKEKSVEKVEVKKEEFKKEKSVEKPPSEKVVKKVDEKIKQETTVLVSSKEEVITQVESKVEEKKQEVVQEMQNGRHPNEDKLEGNEQEKTDAPKPINPIQQFINNEIADHFKTTADNTEAIPKPSEEVASTEGSQNMEESVTDMTASMIKVRLNTEEEAKAALAERRRLAREEAERLAEMERLRKEEEARLEFEAQQREEEQQRLLIEQMKQAEQERLEEAIREAQIREEEERLRKEEENRQKIIKEEADKKAREEAERQKAELQERLKHEEKEREMRRKRVEAIMSRTRGKTNSSAQNDEKNDENKSDKMNGSKTETPENGHKNGKDITVDNIINVESIKNANTVTVDSTLGTDDTINSNNSWQHSNQDLLM